LPWPRAGTRPDTNRSNVRRIDARPERIPFPTILSIALAVFMLTAAEAGRNQAVPARAPAAPQPDLPSLLESAAQYCDRLSRSVLDFVCRERVSEWSFPEAAMASSARQDGRALRVVDFIRRGPKVSNAYLYDYQLVRDRTGSIRETRTLLRENKKDINVPDAALKTRLFWHAKIVMGPLGLLSRERQAEHDYRIVRERLEGPERIVVIEAVPRPEAAADHLVGTIWLRVRDAGILKIEWNPSSIDNYAGVLETAERLRMTPRIVLTSEYGFDKNGIRFPSRYAVQETYARGGRRFQRSETTVVYDQYKFFTVETTVVY